MGKKLPSGFMRAAAAYKAQVADRVGMDFSDAALRSQFEHETYGAPSPDPKSNGYTLGKWTLDATLAAQREDYEAGLFTKGELMEGASEFARRQIHIWPAIPFFVFQSPTSPHPALSELTIEPVPPDSVVLFEDDGRWRWDNATNRPA